VIKRYIYWIIRQRILVARMEELGNVLTSPFIPDCTYIRKTTSKGCRKFCWSYLYHSIWTPGSRQVEAHQSDEGQCKGCYCFWFSPFFSDSDSEHPKDMLNLSQLCVVLNVMSVLS